MGLFDKVKNILFEEEEVVEEVKVPEYKEEPVKPRVEYKEVKEYKPLPESNVAVDVPKKPTFEKVETNDFSERELFKSDSTFKFPAFDEQEFNESMPHARENENHNFTNQSSFNNRVNNSRGDFESDYDKRRKQERRQEYSRFDTFKAKEEVKEEKKRFKPSPVISPVYGILDKDYKVEDIKEAPKNTSTILTSKDLDVESVRAKAFGKLSDNLERQKKPIFERETYSLKDDEEVIVNNVKEEDIINNKEDVIITEEPIIEDSSKLMEERTKTIDELLKDASDEVISANEDALSNHEDTLDDINVEDTYNEIENEFDDAINELEESKKTLENDTLENDLYDLIDSMYDNTEEGE